MQDNLKGRTILVGKEPGGSRLFVSVRIKEIGNVPKCTPLPGVNNVPNSVSRCKVNEDIAHFSLSISNNGAITITNLKPQNTTSVNGSEVIKKVIREGSRLSLGKDDYPVSLSDVLDTASKIVALFVKPDFSIRPLKKVWTEYHARQIEIKKKPQRLGNIQMFSSFLTIAGGGLWMALDRLGVNVQDPATKAFFGALSIAGIIVFVYTFIKKNRFDPVDEGEKLEQVFHKKYICPNPECHHFVGNLSYDLLRQYKNCPHCKCKWTED